MATPVCERDEDYVNRLGPVPGPVGPFPNGGLGSDPARTYPTSWLPAMRPPAPRPSGGRPPPATTVGGASFAVVPPCPTGRMRGGRSVAALTAVEGIPHDHLRHEIGDGDRARTAIAIDPCFLLRDRRPELDGERVVGRDLRSDPVLERRDDLAARRVVFGIRGEDERDVQVQANGIAFDLDVAFLHDVEEPHLNLARQVRQLVDREDATIGPR